MVSGSQQGSKSCSDPFVLLLHDVVAKIPMQIRKQILSERCLPRKNWFMSTIAQSYDCQMINFIRKSEV